MSSFELKPQTRVSLETIRSPERIIWTHPRSELPLHMEGRVSLSQWQSTFDGLMAIYRKLGEGTDSLIPWMFIPCCICFMMPKMATIASEVHTMWEELVVREQKQYRQLGIQVTLAKELMTSGAGSHRHLKNETVGLKFDIAPGVPTATVVSMGGGDLASQLGGGSAAVGEGDNIVLQLEKLNRLHQTGAITSGEYDQAKAKLLA